MSARLAAAGAALLAVACSTQRVEPTPNAQLELAVTALRDGRVEQAQDLIVEVRRRHPNHVAAAQWSSVIAEPT